jgi:hypothetical protein
MPPAGNITDVSGGCTAFFFRVDKQVEQSASNLFGPFLSGLLIFSVKNGGSTFLRHVGKFLQAYGVTSKRIFDPVNYSFNIYFKSICT